MTKREIPFWFKGNAAEYSDHCVRQEQIYAELVRRERTPEYREQVRRWEAAKRAEAHAAAPCVCRVCKVAL